MKHSDRQNLLSDYKLFSYLLFEAVRDMYKLAENNKIVSQNRILMIKQRLTIVSGLVNTLTPPSKKKDVYHV